MITIETTGRVLALGLAFTAAAAGGDGGIIFVDLDAPLGGNGQTWETACQSLQDALAASERSGGFVTEIRVAEGVYRPDLGESQITGDRAASFRLQDAVAIRGGFAGLGARDPNARDIELFPTVLTGDLAGNDGENFTGIDDNSFHVVRGDLVGETAVLEGVQVVGGNADGTAPDDRGAGMLLENAGPTIRDVVFHANIATAGGGIYAVGVGPILRSVTLAENDAALGGGFFLADAGAEMIGCTFERNHAVTGGGMYADNGDATMVGTLFLENEADFDGGGMSNVGGDPTLADCRFFLNRATFDGGGLHTVVGSPTLLDCTFFTNCAADGGGLHVVAGSPTLIDCRFADNSATDDGGGAHVSSGDPAFVACVFDGNHATRGGGASIDQGASTLTGCLWSANDATDDGGAAFVGGGSPAFVFCEIVANTSGRRGAGLAVSAGSPTIRDSCFTRNIVAGGFVSSGGGVHVAHEGDATLIRCEISACEAKFGAGVSIENAGATLTDCTLSGNLSISGGGLFVAPGTAVLTDCVIEGNTAAEGALAHGGGVFARDSQLALDRCIVRGNTADRSGAGIYAEDAALTLTKCTIEDNVAAASGGGLYSQGGAPRLEECVFSGNSGVNGGGFFNLLGDAIVLQCLFTGNVARGIEDDDGCTNGGLGGGGQSIGGQSMFVGCTFSANSVGCGGSGGGLAGVTGTLRNCVLWGNTDAGGADESAQIDGGAPDLQFSCVQGLTGGLRGDGNIGLDPLFVDALGPDGEAGTPDDDLRLGAGSPCIDAGENESVPPGLPLDLAGNSRFVDDPSVRDTGLGDPPLVDLGVYERQASACAADFDGDGVVGFTDLLVLLFAWGACGDCPEDIDASGAVGFVDLLLLLDSWGECG